MVPSVAYLRTLGHDAAARPARRRRRRRRARDRGLHVQPLAVLALGVVALRGLRASVSADGGRFRGNMRGFALSQPSSPERLESMELQTADPTGRGAAFEEHRGRLWGVAYRMLGSRADADDMVQEAYLRWHVAATGDVRAPQAWLVTTTTRLCIDCLRQRRAERDAYVGPWLPEPLVEDEPAADAAAELAEDLSIAFLALLERLAPRSARRS